MFNARGILYVYRSYPPPTPNAESINNTKIEIVQNQMRPSLEKALVERKKLLDEVRREMVKKIREISKDSNFDSKGNLTQEAHQEFVDFCLTQPNSGVRFDRNASYRLIDKNRMDELFNLIEFTANNGKKYTLYFPKNKQEYSR